MAGNYTYIFKIYMFLHFFLYTNSLDLGDFGGRKQSNQAVGGRQENPLLHRFSEEDLQHPASLSTFNKDFKYHYH